MTDLPQAIQTETKVAMLDGKARTRFIDVKLLLGGGFASYLAVKPTNSFAVTGNTPVSHVGLLSDFNQLCYTSPFNHVCGCRTHG